MITHQRTQLRNRRNFSEAEAEANQCLKEKGCTTYVKEGTSTLQHLANDPSSTLYVPTYWLATFTVQQPLPYLYSSRCRIAGNRMGNQKNDRRWEAVSVSEIHSSWTLANEDDYLHVQPTCNHSNRRI